MAGDSCYCRTYLKTKKQNPKPNRTPKRTYSPKHNINKKPFKMKKITNFTAHPLMPCTPSDFEFNLGLMPQWKY